MFLVIDAPGTHGDWIQIWSKHATAREAIAARGSRKLYRVVRAASPNQGPGGRIHRDQESQYSTVEEG